MYDVVASMFLCEDLFNKYKEGWFAMGYGGERLYVLPRYVGESWRYIYNRNREEFELIDDNKNVILRLRGGIFWAGLLENAKKYVVFILRNFDYNNCGEIVFIVASDTLKTCENVDKKFLESIQIKTLSETKIKKKR